jgi:hypothetical protein
MRVVGGGCEGGRCGAGGGGGDDEEEEEEGEPRAASSVLVLSLFLCTYAAIVP